MNNKSHEYWMNLAIEEAQKSYLMSEVPVGAILVVNNNVISYGHNTSISYSDPTAHAEINVIRQASAKLDNYRLTGASLYVTLEPCTMCFGAIVHSRISNLFFGAFDFKTGVCGSCENLNNSSCHNHKLTITGGILEFKCSKIMKDFFKERRN